MSYHQDTVVYALRLYQEHGQGAVAEAERRMEEARTRSSSDWQRWLIVRDSLKKALEPRP